MSKIENSVTPFPEEIITTYKWLDEYLQEQPSTEKVFQSAWQAYKYMLRDKMYAYIGVNDQNGRPIITLKLEPMFSDMLRGKYEDIIPGYYMNKAHWSSIYLDGNVPQDIIADIVSKSHNVMLLSLSKKAQREILGE